MKKAQSIFLPILLALTVFLSACAPVTRPLSFTRSDVPEFSDQPYVLLNDNLPDFPDTDYTETSFEEYSSQDLLGRCGPAYANVSPDTMPTEPRGEIGQVKPSGWHTVKYDLVDGKYLYNRCHLLGYQLTGENANEENLITGTRYMNVEGMLPFENEVADYVKETGNHVLYRVTPVFERTELVARGVQMEAESVEDGGDGVRFNVYVYNAQPGVTIDYATGDSYLTGEEADASSDIPVEERYVLNTKSMKFHRTDCSGVRSMSESNRRDYTGNREKLVDEGYAPCGQCKP